MKKIVLTAAAALLVAGCANTQNQGYQQGYYVPADAQAMNDFLQRQGKAF